MGFLSHFGWVPFELGFLPASALACWKLLNYPVLLPLYLARQVRAYRTMGLGDAVFAFGLLGMWLLVCGVVVRIPYGDFNTLPVRQAADALWPLATVGEVAVLGVLLRRWFRNSDRILLVGTLALGCGIGPSLLPRVTRGIPISQGEAGAFAYLRDRTPFESVVIHARGDVLEPKWPFNWYPVVSALGGRRCVLEYFNWHLDPEHNRQRDIRRLFVTTDLAEAEEILKRYNVNYVLEYRRQPLRFSSGMLRPVYDGGDARLYEFVDPSPKAL
jgi:hypothetical protein